jgi:hypothetical protein
MITEYYITPVPLLPSQGNMVSLMSGHNFACDFRRYNYSQYLTDGVNRQTASTDHLITYVRKLCSHLV